MGGFRRPKLGGNAPISPHNTSDFLHRLLAIIHQPSSVLDSFLARLGIYNYIFSYFYPSVQNGSQNRPAILQTLGFTSDLSPGITHRHRQRRHPPHLDLRSLTPSFLFLSYFLSLTLRSARH